VDRDGWCSSDVSIVGGGAEDARASDWREGVTLKHWPFEDVRCNVHDVPCAPACALCFAEKMIARSEVLAVRERLATDRDSWPPFGDGGICARKALTKAIRALDELLATGVRSATERP
jgi:hypothetical protein